MNELEKYIESEANKHNDLRKKVLNVTHDEAFNAYMVAFGDIMELDLPVKFAEWREHQYIYTTYKTHPQFWDKVHFSEYRMKSFEFMYKYWIDYIYKP